MSISRRAFFGAPKVEAESTEELVAKVTKHCLNERGVLCELCTEVCEAGAIRVRPVIGGKKQVEIDDALCIGCADCVAFCPEGGLELGGAAA